LWCNKRVAESQGEIARSAEEGFEIEIAIEIRIEPIGEIVGFDYDFDLDEPAINPLKLMALGNKNEKNALKMTHIRLVSIRKF
jgi:hypothetical protein